MRSKTANWFICKIRYEKTQEDGLQKKVTESYVVDAVSFGEAESRIIEEMQAYISGEFEVIDISRAAFKEIFFIFSKSPPQFGHLVGSWRKPSFSLFLQCGHLQKTMRTTMAAMITPIATKNRMDCVQPLIKKVPPMMTAARTKSQLDNSPAFL